MNIITEKKTKAIISIVKEAKKFITDDNIHSITEKGRQDYVTKVDTDIQTFVRENLKEIYPCYNFLGEENGYYDMNPTVPTWILDPIDGTTNLIHGFNYCAISLGLVYENEALFGIVYNPFTEELFFAQKGKGAYLNDKKIIVSNVTNLSNALISIGTSPYDKTPDMVNKRFESFKKIFMECPDIRRSGSAALDICYVASGKTDAYFEEFLKPWDYAAATCILEEAGGKITTSNGDNLTYFKNSNILATNYKLHKIMIDIIN